MDKIAHFIAYFTLMAWFSQVYHTHLQRLYCIIGFYLLGIILEMAQKLGGIRHADLMDVIANVSGILLAWQLTKSKFNTILVKFEEKWLNAS